MAGTRAVIGECNPIWRTSLALVLLKPLGRFWNRLPFLRRPAIIVDVLRVPSTEDSATNRPIQTASGLGAHKEARALILSRKMAPITVGITRGN